MSMNSYEVWVLVPIHQKLTISAQSLEEATVIARTKVYENLTLTEKNNAEDIEVTQVRRVMPPAPPPSDTERSY